MNNVCEKSDMLLDKLDGLGERLKDYINGDLSSYHSVASISRFVPLPANNGCHITRAYNNAINSAVIIYKLAEIDSNLDRALAILEEYVDSHLRLHSEDCMYEDTFSLAKISMTLVSHVLLSIIDSGRDVRPKAASFIYWMLPRQTGRFYQRWNHNEEVVLHLRELTDALGNLRIGVTRGKIKDGRRAAMSWLRYIKTDNRVSTEADDLDIIYEPETTGKSSMSSPIAIDPGTNAPHTHAPVSSEIASKFAHITSKPVKKKKVLTVRGKCGTIKSKEI